MRLPALALMAAGVAAAGQPGLTPRPEATSYPAHATSQQAAVGAALLSPEQVGKMFATDLTRGYVVVEVGLYPKQGAVDVGPGDFMLRVAGTDVVVRPLGPKALAAIRQKNPTGGRDIAVFPQVGVGYESGPDVYGRRRGGVYTSVGTGVGVGTGGPPPASTPDDRKTMELELSEQQFPEQVTAKPVAGYLYFPAPSKKKAVAYELVCQGPAGSMVVPLEPVKESK